MSNVEKYMFISGRNESRLIKLNKNLLPPKMNANTFQDYNYYQY